MPLAPQYAAAEQARRTIGRIVASADHIDVKPDQFRINLVIIRDGLCRYDDHTTSLNAVAQINRQTEVAVVLGEAITFQMCPVFPSFEVNSADPSTYA